MHFREAWSRDLDCFTYSHSIEPLSCGRRSGGLLQGPKFLFWERRYTFESKTWRLIGSEGKTACLAPGLGFAPVEALSRASSCRHLPASCGLQAICRDESILVTHGMLALAGGISHDRFANAVVDIAGYTIEESLALYAALSRLPPHSDRSPVSL